MLFHSIFPEIFFSFVTAVSHKNGIWNHKGVNMEIIWSKLPFYSFQNAKTICVFLFASIRIINEK